MGFIEQIHGERRSGGFRGCFLATLGITLGILICTFSVYVAVDVSCTGDAGRWLPDYPGAEVVSQTYSWLRPFGIGETIRVLYSPDSRRDVVNWYADRDQARVDRGDARDGGPALMRWAIVPPANGASGSTIILTSVCSPELRLW
jgi:hypothetical protein